MADDADAMGPISYLILEFPGNKVTGEGLAALVDLVDRGLVRILDLEFVARGADGSMTAIQLRDVDHDGQLDLAVFEGVRSGLLDQSDLDGAADAVREGVGRGHPALREPLGRRLRAGAAPERGRAGGSRVPTARGPRRPARRHRSPLTAEERTRT